MYNDKQIEEMTKVRMDRLMSGESKVATLPNKAKPYGCNKEARDSHAIRDANVESRLFQATFNDEE
jgi:hypothetical protein